MRSDILTIGYSPTKIPLPEWVQVMKLFALSRHYSNAFGNCEANAMGSKNTSKATTTNTVKASKSKPPTPEVEVKGKRKVVKPTRKPYEQWEASGSKMSKPDSIYKKLDKENTGCTARGEGSQTSMKWNGHSITAICRWMGNAGANTATALVWLRAMGFSVHKTTVSCHVTSGRAGANGWENAEGEACEGGWRGTLPELSAAEAKYLRSIMPETVEAEESDISDE